MRRILGSLLRSGCGIEVGEDEFGDGDKFKLLGFLDVVKKLGFDFGSRY